MEYVYAAMLLHSAEKEIDDKAVTAVLTAAGVDVDGARVKALVSSLGSVDIGEAMATAVAAPVAAGPAAAGGGGSSAAEAAPAEAVAEEVEEDDGGGFEGLGSLFG
jgi:large subunit ribosomal protein L12